MSEDFYVIPEMSRKRNEMAFVCIGCKNPEVLKRAKSGDFSGQIEQLQSRDAKRFASEYASSELGIQKPRFTTGSAELFPLNKENKNVSELIGKAPASETQIERYVILLEVQESQM